MSPRAPEPPDEAVLDELRRLGSQRTTAEADLKVAVLHALAAGGSIRTIAAAAGLSPTTVQKWKAGP